MLQTVRNNRMNYGTPLPLQQATAHMTWLQLPFFAYKCNIANSFKESHALSQFMSETKLCTNLFIYFQHTLALKPTNASQE